VCVCVCTCPAGRIIGCRRRGMNGCVCVGWSSCLLLVLSPLTRHTHTHTHTHTHINSGKMDKATPDRQNASRSTLETTRYVHTHTHTHIHIHTYMWFYLPPLIPHKQKHIHPHPHPHRSNGKPPSHSSLPLAWTMKPTSCFPGCCTSLFDRCVCVNVS
jgi:hypothetical protein